MGMLVNGEWLDQESDREIAADGRFARVASSLRDTVTADGLSGLKAEPGRYHLYVAHACPWAHRTVLYRAIKKLDDVISIAAAIAGPRPKGWFFRDDPDLPDCIPDRVNGFTHLSEAYLATDHRFTGKVTVPALWDRVSGRVVNNESADIIRMFNSAFDDVTGERTDFYPENLRDEIDRLNDVIYRCVNNGVYRCGFATSQAAYDEAFDQLFAALDDLDAHLAHRRYLCGDRITEADWRLFPTLVRFDVAYFSAFKCNRQRIADYEHLSRYASDLHEISGVAETVKPRQYILSYFSNSRVNPNGIIPRGTPATLPVKKQPKLDGPGLRSSSI